MKRPTKPRRRRRQDDLDQARLNFSPYEAPPHEATSNLGREVQEHAEQARREPLPGQGEMPWEKPQGR